MNKRAIVILGAIFVLIVATLGVLVYLKYAGSGGGKTAATSPSTASSTAPAGGGPVAGDQPAPAASSTPAAPTSTVVQLTADQVVSPVLSFSGGGITYFDNQGNLYQTTLQNNGGQWSLTGKKQLDIPQKSNINKVFWPLAGEDFIAQTQSSSGTPAWSYFNSGAASFTDFPPQVEAFDWLPSGQKVVYEWVSGGKGELETADPAFKSWQQLTAMYQADNALSVSPDGSQILFYEKTPQGATNSINSVSIDGKVFKGLVTSGYNSGVLWSPDSQKFLFGKKDPASGQYQLWYYNLSSGETVNLGLFTTPDKAVWGGDSNTVYAAVPSTISAQAGGLTTDTFYSVNISTQARQTYSTGGTAVDGQNLFLNLAGNVLFFKNAQDGGLYYLSLSQ